MINSEHSKSMRVIHVVHSLRRGGAERVLLELALGMRERGCDVGVVSLTGVNEYREPPYDTLEWRFLIQPDEYRWPRGIISMARKLSRTLSDLRPDVIEIHTPNAAIVAAVAGLDAPAVEMFHGYEDNWREQLPLKAGAYLRLQRWALRRLGRNAISIAPEMSGAISKWLKCSSERIRCIPNGVDVSRFGAVTRKVDDQPIIAVVGTLSEVKRPDAALRAFARLRQQMPGATLRFIGDGPLRGELAQMIQKERLGDSVQLLGRRADVAELLAQSHLFWQLSRSEGFGMACLEAMASGLPVVATCIPGLRDLVRDGETGFLVPLGDDDAVAERSFELLCNQSLYGAMSIAARARAATKFSLDKMVEQHIRALRDLRDSTWTAAPGREAYEVI